MSGEETSPSNDAHVDANQRLGNADEQQAIGAAPMIRSEETQFARSAVTELWAIAIAFAKLTASLPPWLLTAIP